MTLTGYGEGAGPDAARQALEESEQRTDGVRDRFLAALDTALAGLQAAVPQDAPRLKAAHFDIVGRPRGRNTDPSASLDAGRQVTLEILDPVATLNAVRLADPRMRTGPLDVDAMARHLLRLPADATVDDAVRQNLYGLVVEASRDGWGDSLGALGVYRIAQQGALDPNRDRHLTVGGRRAPGLNWAKDTVLGLEDTDTFEILRETADGGLEVSEEKDTPWKGGPTPYLVVASGRHDMVRVKLPDDTTRDLTIDEFVELVARDPELSGLPLDVPIVLAIPHAGDRELDLPRLLADRTGRTVWSHGGLAMADDPRIGVLHKDKTVQGDWVPSPPGMAPDRGANVPAWWRKVATRTVISATTAQRIGRESHDPAEMVSSRREEFYRRLDSMKAAHFNVATRTYVSNPVPLPYPGKPGAKRHHWVMHGGPGYVTFHLEDGTTHTAWYAEGARYIAHRKSTQALGEDDGIELVVCWAGSPVDRALVSGGPRSDRWGFSYVGSFVPDPLAEVSFGQHVANETRHKTNTTIRVSGTGVHPDGTYIRVLYTDRQGRRQWYAQFYPEPDAAELDRRVRETYYDGPLIPAWAREYTLRLVRALKLTLGNDVDDRVQVDQDPEYAELLRGAYALDRMRRREPSLRGTGPFTLDFFRRVVEARLPAGQTEARQADYRNVLKAAAAVADGTKLSDFVTLPSSVRRAAEWKATVDLSELATKALHLDTKPYHAEWSRMFWARVKTYEALDTSVDLDELTAQLRDLPSTDQVDDAGRDATRELMTTAFAIGLDGSDPAVLYGYHLDNLGAVADTTALHAPGTPDEVSGRDYRPGPKDAFPDLSKVGTPSGVQTAPWAGKDPVRKNQDRPAPYVVRASVDPKVPGRLLVSFGNITRSLSPRQFTGLLDRDRHLLRRDLTTPLLLDIPEFDRHFPGAARDMAQHLGREVFTTSAVTGQSVPQDAQRPVLALSPPAQAGPSPAAVAWNSTKPVDPQNPADVARPVPLPAPEAASEKGPAPAANRTFAVRFDAGSAMLSEDDVADIEDLAREVAPSVLAEWRAGRPVPSFVVTGFGEGPADQARELGQERAEAVLEWFQDHLDDALTRLQAGNTPWVDRLTTEGLRFSARSRGGGLESGRDPEALRQTTIELTTSMEPFTAPEPDTESGLFDSESDSGSDTDVSSVFDSGSDSDTDTDTDTESVVAPDDASAAKPRPKVRPQPGSVIRSAPGAPMPGLQPLTPLPVRVAPVTPPDATSAALVPPTRVAFAPGSGTLSEDAGTALRDLAGQVARIGLDRHGRGVAKPSMTILGYGEGTPQDAESEALRRASAVYERFMDDLDLALERLQGNVPEDSRITADDFHIVWRGRGAEVGETGTTPDAHVAALRCQVTIELADPIATLRELRLADPDLVNDPLDSDVITRSILHLAPDAPVDADVNERLYALITDAAVDGWATSLGALGAYHAFQQGVIAPNRDRYFTMGGTRVPGLNWDTDKVAELVTDSFDIIEKLPDGSFGSVETDAEWRGGPRPYVVAAGGSHEKVVMPWPDGTTRDLTIDEFIELVARDLEREGLPKDHPIVLAVPFAGDQGLDLPRRLAERTGRTVWAHSGHALAGSEQGLMSIGVFHESGRHHGDWIPSPPGMAPDRRPDLPEWYRKVLTRTIMDVRSKRQAGRSGLPDAEVSQWGMEDDQRHFGTMTHYVHVNPLTGQVVSKKIPLPRRGRTYTWDGHGGPGWMQFQLADGTSHYAYGAEGPRYLAHRKSVQNLGEDDWIHMESCWSGSPMDRAIPSIGYKSSPFPGALHALSSAFVPDPLADISVAQHTANETRKKISATFGPIGSRVHEGEYVITVSTDPQGRLGSIVTFYPEPDPAELDRRASVAGYHTGTGEVSEEAGRQTLRLVRALKLTLGNDVDDRVRVEQDPAYAELLRGAAALDRMWRDDPRSDDAGPFTLDLLQRVVTARLPEGRTGARQDDYRAVFTAAAAAPEGTPLTAFAPRLTGALDEAAAWWSGVDPVVAAAAALSMDDPQQVGTAELSRVFWGRVKMYEALDAPGADLDRLTTQLFGLTPDDDLRDATRWLMATLYVVGRDGGDPVTVRSGYLESLGVLADATAVFTPDDAGNPSKLASGRHFVDAPNTADLDLSKIWTPGGVVDAPWAKGIPGYDPPTPYVVRASVDLNNPGRLTLFFDGSDLSVSEAEFVELLANDRHLLVTPWNTAVVLDISQLDRHFPGLAERLAQRIGHSVHSTSLPLDRLTPPGSQSPLLALMATPVAPPPTAADFHETEPIAPDPPVNAPRPVPASPPRSADRIMPSPGARMPSLPPALRSALAKASAAGPARAPATSSAALPMSAPRLSADQIADLAAQLNSDQVHTVPVGDPPTAPATTTPTAPSATPAASTAGPSVLPRSTPVAFDGQSAEVSAEREADIARLAALVAETGLRNKRARLPVPPVLITGYGDGAARQLADRRADAVAAVFRRHLDRALTALGAADQGLSADDFGIAVVHDGQVPQGPASAPVTIGITTHRHAAAVLRLDELRQAEPDLRDGVFRPNSLARRVLGLDGSAPVTTAQRAILYTVTGQAMKDGRAGSLADLAAYYAEKEARLYEGHRFTTGGVQVPGLNWTGLPDSELYTDTIGLMEERPGAAPAILDSSTPKWHKDSKPYLLAATMNGDRVRAPSPDGKTRDTSVGRFVERVLKDPELAKLPAGAPIVLVVPYAGDGAQYLARLLAERTGRTVWAHSGDARLMTTPDGRLAVAVFKASGRPVGDWFPVPPGMLPDPDDDGGRPDWYDDVLSRPLASALTALQIGRASFQPEEMAVREEAYRHLDQVTKYVHFNFAARTHSRTFTLEPAARGRLKAFFATHGGAGYTSFAKRGGGTRQVRNAGGAKWLKRRKSFTHLLQDRKEDWLGLVICRSGSAKDSAVPRRGAYDRNQPRAFVPNPLRHVAQGQHYANEMRHKVSAAIVKEGVRLQDGEYVRFLTTDPQGRWGSYAEFFPEPETDELDRRARAIGLHSGPGPVPAEARQRTLDLVRALKTTLGNEVDDDVRIEQDPGYAELLRGAAVLERMWRDDPRFGQAGPFTLDFFERVVAAKLSLGQAEPSRDDYRAVLTQALDSGPGTPLADFVTLPPAVDRAVARLGGANAAQEIADVLQLSGTDKVGEDERSRMFWARVKAYEALGALDAAALDAYTASVLHRDPSEVDDARREQARELTAAAYGVGRDGADPVQVAAYHMETERALSDATAIPPLQGGGPAAGRNLLGAPAGNTAVDLSKVHTPGGTVDAPWHGRTRKGKVRPAPYVVRAELDRNDPSHLFVSYGGVTRRVPAAEFVELVAGDPDLLTLDSAVPVFLAISELDRLAPGLAQDLAQRIGRQTYSTEFPLGEHTADGTADPVFSLHPSPVTGAAPTAAALRLSSPRALDSVNLPAPGPLPPVNADTPGSSRDGGRAPAPTLDPDAPVPGLGDPLPFLGGRVPGLDDPLPDLTTALTQVPPPAPPAPPPPPSPLGPTPPPGQNPRPKPAGVQIDEELEERRRPRIDSYMMPPPQVHRPSKFTDDSRMPGYVDGFLPFPGDASDDTALPIAFGQSDVYIRGWEQIVEHIDTELTKDDDEETAPGEEPPKHHRVRGGGVDESVFRRMQRALRERPQTFVGGGREFVYRAESGRLRKLHIRVRNYGEWTKFTDGVPLVKVDNAARAQATIGGSKSVGQTRQLAPTVPLGPMAGTFAAFGRLGVRLGRIREVNYTMQDQVLNVGETRGWDTSHPYLDDAYVEVRITDAEEPRPAKQGVLGTRWRAKPATVAAPDVEFAFGVRHGLKARLPEGVTKESTVRRTPKRLELGPESDFRFFVTEDFGPVDHIRDWAVDRMGVTTDSSAYTELDRFFSDRNFHQLSGRMRKSPVAGKPLRADDKKSTPLGAFVIDRVELKRAVLDSETDKAEMRDSNFLTVQNARKQTKAIAKDISFVAGPTFNLPTFGLQNLIPDWMNRIKPRIQFGPSMRLGHTRGRSAMTGGSGAVRTVERAKNVTTDQYWVEQVIWIRKTGDEHATPFTAWSLDRITRTEARRLAGMEDENTFGRTEPYAPAYLTKDDPPTLGMARPVQFLYANGQYSRKFAVGTEGEDIPPSPRPSPGPSPSPGPRPSPPPKPTPGPCPRSPPARPPRRARRSPSPSATGWTR
ncbi:lonely Cys domain-containing protein [Streptomyces sp. RTd22]|uniref:lonely Cys domain-containing protein n=1 Tax=Streptomyces sp. RTd22 TaxID=1841249 RepID=UPI002D21A9FF|nr:lonely Cys domain-containing protein [Streptomyces sp. RTd22]